MKPKTINKGVRFPVGLIAEIKNIADKSNRDFSKQVIEFCEKGIEKAQWEASVIKDAEGKLCIQKESETINE